MSFRYDMNSEQYIYCEDKLPTSTEEDIKTIRKLMEQILAELRRGGETIKVEFPTQPLTVGDPRPNWHIS